MAKRMTAAQKRGLAKGRKTMAARRKNKGKGKFCVITRASSGKSSTRCFKTEQSAFDSAFRRKPKGGFKSVMLYRRKNA